MIHRILILFTFAATMVWATPQASAQIRNVSEVISFEVMPGWRRADGVHVAALRVKLTPGWITYWRSAGSLGIAPQMDWRQSNNVRSVTPSWPTPRVFEKDGALSIGYDRDFILPLLIPTRDAAAPVQLRGDLDIGVCQDICLPAKVSVAAVLPPGGAPERSIETALADRPRRVEARATCRLAPIDQGMSLTGTIDIPPQGRAETVVFELPDPSVWVTDATVRREGGRLTASSDLFGSGGTFSVDRSRVRITVIGPNGAIEINGCLG